MILLTDASCNSGISLSGYDDENTEALVKKYLDIIVLSMLNGNPVHGYKIIANIHNSFGVLLSPGTLYPLLYRLEAEKYLTVDEVDRRKLYQLTSEGLRKVTFILNSYKRNIKRIFYFVDQNLGSGKKI